MHGIFFATEDKRIPERLDTLSKQNIELTLLIQMECLTGFAYIPCKCKISKNNIPS